LYQAFYAQLMFYGTITCYYIPYVKTIRQVSIGVGAANKLSENRSLYSSANYSAYMMADDICPVVFFNCIEVFPVGR